ncbi:TetR/AcrR family transcriptional regulator C-terminal domain-containing protein [Nocardioides euryhalodurans]|uniref:TetR/AcrR family transcriptional regulator C-terminal domain-containing protein n=1 Tax=Nocardioides euryhalodurans TaxID=2518370 RepID=UPI001FCA0684|nr:TetR/AcrR family transcriptional regulator C-terminal domain-containing protein [Nocardioides euryhalodurans]
MPTRTPLSRERIHATALELADEHGLAGLSMRSLATALGVEAMSLYHHVPGKDALLDGLVDAVFAEFHLPVVGEDWTEQMRARSGSAREAMKRHRWAIGLMDSRRTPGPETLRHHDAVLGCLRAAGFSLELAGHAAALLDAHLYGFVVQEVSLPFQDEGELADLGSEILTGLPEGELVHFREYAVDRALQPGYDFGDEFGWGLELVLEGIARRLAEEQA